MLSRKTQLSGYTLSASSTPANKRQAWQLQLAAYVLRRGGIIAHPTEAVWGLACDPFNATAVRGLLALKNRAESKGLILASGQAEHFEPLLAPLDSELRERFYARAPHPVTWLLPDTEKQIPAWIKGAHHSVAVRLSEHPIISALSNKLGSAIISTSANPAGLPPAKSIFRVHQYFANSLAYILPASLGQFSRPSIIRDLQTGNIIRV